LARGGRWIYIDITTDSIEIETFTIGCLFFGASGTHNFLKTSLRSLRQRHIWSGFPNLEIAIRIGNSM